MIKSNLFARLRRSLLLASLAVGSLGAAQAQISFNDISADAQDQIASLLAEKDSRTPIQNKIDSQLLYATHMAAGKAITNRVQALELNINKDKRERVLVDINATVTKALLRQIRKLDGEVVNSYAELNAIRAWMPLNNLETLVNRPAVLFVRPAGEAETTRYDLPKAERKADRKKLKELLQSLPPAETQTGSVTTEGDATHRGPAARATIPAGTSGLRIGVLSDSIDDASGSYAAAVAAGDVPPVTVIPGQAGSGAGEGLAMLEIVADICPGAKLYFATAFGSQAGFAANILALRAAGCDIIIDDVQYFAESPFYDDNVAQSVNTVTASGAFYFSSAGNSGNQGKNSAGVWEGNFVDGGAYTTPVNAGNAKSYRVHNFGTTTPQLYDAFPATTPTGGGTRYGFLQWNDSPAAGSSNDYDLFYLDAAGTTIVNSSTNVQNGTAGQIAFEGFQCSTPASGGFTNSRFVVVKTASAANRYIRFHTGRGYLTITTPGQTYGHNSTVNGYAVAGTPAAAGAQGGNPLNSNPPSGPFPAAFNSSNKVEIFSSEGPRRLFFNPDGTFLGTPNDFTAAGGIIRNTPVFTAADGVTTTLPPASGLNPFYGTSASAPHAGAIAGILLAKNPNLTQAQMRAALTSTAIDIEAPGYENVSGAGILDALAAVNAVTAGPGKLSGGIDYRVLTPDGTGVVTRGTAAKVYVALANTGGNTSLTGATGVLTTTTPNVVVRARPSTYGAIAPAATVENDTPFLVTTTAGFQPAGTIALNYALTYNSVTTNYPFTIPTAFTVGALQRFETTAPLPQVVPDANATGISIPFTVSGFTVPIGKVAFSVFADNNDVNSSYIGDLTLTLISPDGTAILLKGTDSAQATGGTKLLGTAATPDSARCTFDDAATTAITAAAPPYAGTFRPAQALSGFSGKSANGTWTLKVVDGFTGDTSKVNAVSLFVAPVQ